MKCWYENMHVCVCVCVLRVKFGHFKVAGYMISSAKGCLEKMELLSEKTQTM